MIWSNIILWANVFGQLSTLRGVLSGTLGVFTPFTPIESPAYALSPLPKRLHKPTENAVVIEMSLNPGYVTASRTSPRDLDCGSASSYDPGTKESSKFTFLIYQMQVIEKLLDNVNFLILNCPYNCWNQSIIFVQNTKNEVSITNMLIAKKKGIFVKLQIMKCKSISNVKVVRGRSKNTGNATSNSQNKKNFDSKFMYFDNVTSLYLWLKCMLDSI